MQREKKEMMFTNELCRLIWLEQTKAFKLKRHTEKLELDPVGSGHHQV